MMNGLKMIQSTGNENGETAVSPNLSPLKQILKFKKLTKLLLYNKPNIKTDMKQVNVAQNLAVRH